MCQIWFKSLSPFSFAFVITITINKLITLILHILTLHLKKHHVPLTLLLAAFFYMSCPFMVWAIIALHNLLSLVSLHSVSPFAKYFNTYSANYSHKLIRYVACCLLLSHFPSICSGSVKFSKHAFLMCPGNFSCLY